MATTETSPAATARATSSRAACSRSATATRCAPAGSARTRTTATCQAVVAYNLTTGTIRGVDVSGLTLVGVVHIPGNILEGNWRRRCSWTTAPPTSRRTRCSTASAGSSAVRSPTSRSLVGERVSVERAKIEHSIVDGAGTLKVEGKIDCAMQPYRGPDGSITTLNNSIFSTVPGSPAYVARADHQKVNMPEHGTSGSSRARTRSSPTGRSTTGANDRSLPRPILVGIAAAWAAAIAAQLAGAAALVHHDSLLAGGGPPLAVAALASLLAWQVMIAAMMLPSSLPLVGLYARASARAPQRRRAMAAFLGGYALVWSGVRAGWPSARTPACTPR